MTQYHIIRHQVYVVIACWTKRESPRERTGHFKGAVGYRRFQWSLSATMKPLESRQDSWWRHANTLQYHWYFKYTLLKNFIFCWVRKQRNKMNKNDVPTRRSATTGPQILLEMPFKRMKASLQTTLSIKFCRLSKFKNILFFFTK